MRRIAAPVDRRHDAIPGGAGSAWARARDHRGISPSWVLLVRRSPRACPAAASWRSRLAATHRVRRPAPTRSRTAGSDCQQTGFHRNSGISYFADSPVVQPADILRTPRCPSVSGMRPIVHPGAPSHQRIVRISGGWMVACAPGMRTWPPHPAPRRPRPPQYGLALAEGMATVVALSLWCGTGAPRLTPPHHAPGAPVGQHGSCLAVWARSRRRRTRHASASPPPARAAPPVPSQGRA